VPLDSSTVNCMTRRPTKTLRARRTVPVELSTTSSRPGQPCTLIAISLFTVTAPGSPFASLSRSCCERGRSTSRGGFVGYSVTAAQQVHGPPRTRRQMPLPRLALGPSHHSRVTGPSTAPLRYVFRRGWPLIMTAKPAPGGASALGCSAHPIVARDTARIEQQRSRDTCWIRLRVRITHGSAARLQRLRRPRPLHPFVRRPIHTAHTRSASRASSPCREAPTCVEQCQLCSGA
jgi:hypothetical protein